MPAVELIIFDCDGVLVDSEMLSASILMRLLDEAGLPIDFDCFRNEFLGRSFSHVGEYFHKKTGRELAGDFQARYHSQLLAAVSLDLKPMPGLVALLRNLTCPYCLATSSDPERLQLTLEVSGLASFFEGNHFTASQVTHGKPAPDLFLLAAQVMGVQAGNCLVIEDSVQGVKAARAAGMAVWHFTGGSHMPAGYQLPDHIMADGSYANMAGVQQKLYQLGLINTTTTTLDT